MAYILGGIAVFMSFIALWLASSNLKKIEGGNKELKSQIQADVDKIRKDLEEKIDKLEKAVGGVDKKMEAVTKNQTQSKEAVEVLEKKLARTTQELSDLTNSIPPQYRQHRTLNRT